MIWIAADAMCGDAAPAHIVDGALAAVKHFDLSVMLVGPITALQAEVARHPSVDASRVLATIKVAADLVATGEASALFSAGHTGASVMAAHSSFGMLPGVGRPALAATLPTRERPAILLDVGASAACRPPHFVEFAVMGTVYARVDYSEYGGAPLLGASGIAVVVHGRSSAKAVAAARGAEPVGRQETPA